MPYTKTAITVELVTMYCCFYFLEEPLRAAGLETYCALVVVAVAGVCVAWVVNGLVERIRNRHRQVGNKESVPLRREGA